MILTFRCWFCWEDFYYPPAIKHSNGNPQFMIFALSPRTGEFLSAMFDDTRGQNCIFDQKPAKWETSLTPYPLDCLNSWKPAIQTEKFSLYVVILYYSITPSWLDQLWQILGEVSPERKSSFNIIQHLSTLQKKTKKKNNTPPDVPRSASSKQ